ncbi:MAG TPA: SH3 domain-containing protein [Nocardioidaceae bacterium]|nr:SH3 domain-containing protein [Nocardioidaceae bacterium]
MASGRHKLLRDLARSPQQPSRLARLSRLGVPALAATLVTGTVVGAAVAWPEADPGSAAASISAPLGSVDAERLPGSRVEVVSRSAPRVQLEAKPEKKKQPEPTPAPAPEPTPVPDSEIADHLFMTTALNVWSGPGETTTLLEVLPAGTKVAVTGDTEGPWAEISYDGLSRWVTAEYLAEEKPQPEEAETESAGGITDAPCPSGSSVESGLSSDAILVHRSVCASFPEVSSYGGLRSDGEHSQGLALDIMIPSSSTGDAIAEWVRANAGSLGVSEVIWSQQIWTVQRSSEGWRPMEDRGSTTANHYDHVHVTVYG